ncbi:MAG TPA: malto-oligosyltrehalose synthase [Candidatus Micrarchaeia archaeon]|nr:malto-oligosyltrehalose synthase [Candidatus Micrarchaeia archaeon]
MVPSSTYRVQLHAGFTFRDAARIVPYLRRLGVSHLYCSPIQQAASGSTHGYDVVAHARLSDELGGEEGHRELTEMRRGHGMGEVVDIVPNHMAVGGRDNGWWWDVLEYGPVSRYAGYFDIDWTGAPGKDRPTVLRPVLEDQYGRVLEAGAITVVRTAGAFTVRVGEHELPLSPLSLGDLIGAAADQLGLPELGELARAARALARAAPPGSDRSAELHRRADDLRDRLARLCREEPSAAGALDAAVRAVNASPDRLDLLLQAQPYRLAWWRTASEELDYRRFFDIESLIGLRVEDPAVFADTHHLIGELVAAGVVDGLRVDHIDGLRDPLGYLVRLRAASAGVYTVVEKILEADEVLAEDWPVSGTTGYDFLARVNRLFVDPDNESALTACYQQFIDADAPYEEVVHAAKLQVLSQNLASELHSLTRLLATVCRRHRRHRDHTERDLGDALSEVLAAYPVYRTYVQPGRGPSAADRDHVALAVQRAGRRRPDLDRELLQFLGQLALLEHPGAAEAEFALRLAQISAPVMAKGVEDTAFYRYHRLTSLNEVGGAPGDFGSRPADFHRHTARTAAHWPETMLTLSTHDSKRGADVRARINLLSEMPKAWADAVAALADHNQRHRRGRWPDRNAEYLLYQTLVGTWPISAERIVAFMEKAAREAKVHTSWISPAAEYEQALAGFARDVLADRVFVHLLEDFLGCHRLVRLGRVNSLAQTTLLLTCPGVPDLYQGSELWDLTLVDPDNRRPVDFRERARLLERLGHEPPPLDLGDDSAGAWKLWLISRLLDHRQRHPAAYRPDPYRPLIVRGPRADHAVAFARRSLTVVVPRLIVGLQDDWQGSAVELPAGRWRSILTGESVDGELTPLAHLLRRCPVAVLSREPA